MADVLVNPCDSALSVVNTGIDCETAMLQMAGLDLMPRGTTWTMADINAAGSWANFKAMKNNAAAGSRWFSLFGSNAAVWDLSDANEDDVFETGPSGAKLFVRPGMINRTIVTANGGLCFAKALMALGSNFDFIDTDISGNVHWKVNADGSFSGITPILIKGLTPTLAGMQTVFKNRLYICVNPTYYIGGTKIYKPLDGIAGLQIQGLLDAELTNFSDPVQAANTAPTAGTTTITAVGADNDTIQISINGVDVSGVITKTSSESTVTLLAVKIKNAINALVATNGGITATNVAGAITYVIPASYGDTLNTLSAVATIVGTITETHVAFSGGAYGAITFQINVKSECSDTNLVTNFPGTSDPGLVIASNFIVDKDGTLISTPTPTLVVVGGVNDHIQMIVAGGAAGVVVGINGAGANILYGNGVPGYDIISGIEYTIV